jgi:hypothetical protein
VTAADDRIVRWRRDPIAFVREVFGPGFKAETGQDFALDRWQEEALRLLMPHPPHEDCDGSPAQRIAVRAAKGPGKSAFDSWAIWWFMLTRPYANIAVMSISEANLRDGCWKELSTWYGRAPILHSAFELGGERITAKGSADTAKRWFTSARSFPQRPDKSQQAASVAGLHSNYVMVVLDEAGDIQPGVLSAAEGIFANTVDAIVLLTGNCSSTDGALYDASVRRGHRYHVVRVTGDPDDPNRSPRMDLDYCKNLIADYGRQDPVTMINALGEVPLAGIDKLLSPADVTAAERRNPDTRLMAQEPNIYGLDIARHGLDLSALTRRQGPIAFAPKTWRIDDLMQLADAVAHELSIAKPRADALIVGATGIGWGVVDRLKQLGWANIMIAIDEGKAARDQRFADVRTEMWLNLAGWVRSKGSLPESAELRADLLAPGKRQRFLRGATREIMDPSDYLRQVLGRSPDRGTSLALTFAAPVAPKGLQTAQHAQRFAKMAFNPWRVMRGEDA